MKITVALGIIAALLAWMTCKNLQKSTAEPTQPAEEKETSGLMRVPVDALPPASASHRAYLASAYWHLSMAVSPRGENVQPNYEKKWLVFREDQTFDVVIDGKVVDTGRWNWDVDKNYLYLSCKDPYLNNSWSVKDLTFLMIWIGNTDLNNSGIQIRVQGHKQAPWAKEPERN